MYQVHKVYQVYKGYPRFLRFRVSSTHETPHPKPETRRGLGGFTISRASEGASELRFGRLGLGFRV